MSQQILDRWATEAKNHLLKYRPKMASELQKQGKLDYWARKVSDRAGEEFAQSVWNGMSSLEAESEAKKNNLFLPSEEDEPELTVDPNRLSDPASLVTVPGVNRQNRGRRSNRSK